MLNSPNIQSVAIQKIPKVAYTTQINTCKTNNRIFRVYSKRIFFYFVRKKKSKEMKICFYPKKNTKIWIKQIETSSTYKSLLQSNQQYLIHESRTSHLNMKKKSIFG